MGCALSKPEDHLIHSNGTISCPECSQQYFINAGTGSTFYEHVIVSAVGNLICFKTDKTQIGATWSIYKFIVLILIVMSWTLFKKFILFRTSTECPSPNLLSCVHSVHWQSVMEGNSYNILRQSMV